MQAIMINPWDRIIREVNIDAAEFNEQVYQLLSRASDDRGEFYRVDTYELLRIGDTQVLLVDENARVFRHSHDIPHWHFDKSDVPIYGTALAVTAKPDDDDFTGTGLTPEYFEDRVWWKKDA